MGENNNNINNYLVYDKNFFVFLYFRKNCTSTW